MILPLLLAIPITLQGELQHVLDRHSHILLPVRIQTELYSPSEIHWGYPYRPMPKDYIPPIGWVYRRTWGWQIGVRRSEFKTLKLHPLRWIIMHEVCHIIQDHTVLEQWDKLTPKEINDREEAAADCATAMLDRHYEMCE